MAGASVKVLGTSPQRGTIVRPDGFYTVREIPIGTYQVVVSGVGTRNTLEVVISAGKPTEVDFVLAIVNVKVNCAPCRGPRRSIDISGSSSGYTITGDQLLRRGARTIYGGGE